MKRKRGYWPRSTKSKQGREGSRDGGVNRKEENTEAEKANAVGFSLTLEKRCGGRK